MKRDLKVKTRRGEIRTPFFMPIATKAAVKNLTCEEVGALGAQIILSNTYHLHLRPGEDLIEKAGDLHEFMKWEGPILTDSGGYQVFSLAKIRKLKDDGVEFRSPYDGGARHFLTPEKAIAIQLKLGSDIILVLDVCAPYPCERDEALDALIKTSAWAERSRKYFDEKMEGVPEGERPLLFGIIQGSVYEDLRERAAKELMEMGFDGYAIGGLAVGEPAEEMYEVLDKLIPKLPDDKPRYLMGVGKPDQMVEAVKRGIDMFDCVLPTRNARHGYLFTNLRLIDNSPSLLASAKRSGEAGPARADYDIVRINNEKFKEDFGPLDKTCQCPTCQKYSRAYLRHLFMSEEPLFLRLATTHNLWFYLGLMRRLREDWLS